MELEELIHSVDIVEYISQFVELEEKSGEFWGLSCFRDEKTPSFSVRRDPPFFFDYSSGEGGNLFNFVKRYFRCSSKEAVERIQKYAGVDGEIQTASKRMTATSMCKKYNTKKQSYKQQSSTVLRDDHMDRYENREDKLSVWLDEGISRESLERFQVKYDAFSDRLVYPIRNLEGKIVNIGGRTLDPDWKAKELRKYCYFYPWGTIDTIYGLAENMDEILDKKEVILFEGCKSVLLAHSWGVKNCGAILTSHLSMNQMKILARLGVRVVFALDKEIDVTKDKNVNRLRSYVNVFRYVDRESLLGEKDAPVDKGYEVFNSLYKNVERLR